MTKYTTTDEHGWMMAGIILSVNSSHKISLYDGSIIGINKESFNQWISDRWVKKVQKAEFTEDEMQDFAHYCYRTPIGKTFFEMLGNWRKQKS